MFRIEIGRIAKIKVQLVSLRGLKSKVLRELEEQ